MHRAKTLSATFLLFVGCLSFAASAHAATISYTRAAFTAAFPGASVEDWDSFPDNHLFPNGSATAGITYQASSGTAIVTDEFLNTSGPNGLGNTANGGDLSFFGADQSMTFSFGSPIRAFAIDINTFATAPGSYTASTNAGEIVNSLFDPFPFASTGQFIGFATTLPFTAITITPNPQLGNSYTLDTMRFVPEPATVLLLGTGAVGLFVRRRRATRAN